MNELQPIGFLRVLYFKFPVFEVKIVSFKIHFIRRVTSSNYAQRFEATSSGALDLVNLKPLIVTSVIG